MGTLHLVATPIGNLEDLSPRAIRILREARLIAAEDTRQTQKLLSHFDIHTRLISYFEHNKLTRLDAILAALNEGDVALVSDAGTPAINDPGYELVRAALASGFDVRPVPGPSAPIAAVTVSGLPTDAFLYLGYLPRKSSERHQFLSRVADLPYTLIFLETPHRLLDSLDDMLAVLGDRSIAAARELTKLHEEVFRGRISAARVYFKEPRGEFVLVVEGTEEAETEKWPEEKLLAAIQKNRKIGKSAKDIVAQLVPLSGWNKRDIYNLVNISDKEN